MKIKIIIIAAFFFICFYLMLALLVDNRGASLPPCYEIAPPFHHRFKPNCSGTMLWSDRVIRYHVNEDSLRDRPRKEIKKGGVLVLGDSMVEGWGLDQTETLSVRLEEAYHGKLSFINAGLRSSGPILAAYRAASLLDIYKPTQILWVLTGNDLTDDLLSLALIDSVNEKGYPQSFQISDFSLLPLNWIAVLLPSLKHFLYEKTVDYMASKQEKKADTLGKQCLGFQWIQNMAKVRGISIQYVLVGQGKSARDVLAKRGMEKILSCISSINILDLRESMNDNANYFLPNNTHFSAEGARFAAQEIYRNFSFKK